MSKPHCNTCNETLISLGQIGLRTGGMSGVASLVFGNMADFSERVLYFDLYRCSGCGRLEFFDHDFSLPVK